jgi:putative PIN family toxin of toxin-antitoxin system
LVTEILEVLRRPEIAGKFSVLLDISPARVLEILGQAEVVEVEDIPAVCRDPQDDKFLATALAAGVDYLVSEDDDLLSLGTYQGIKITNATRFLELLEQASATRPDS